MLLGTGQLENTTDSIGLVMGKSRSNTGLKRFICRRVSIIGGQMSLERPIDSDA
jgi:hypothetical protein